LDPKLAPAWYHMGFAYFALGRLDKAVRACNKSIDLEPKHTASYDLRAAAYMRLGQYQDAITDARTAFKLEPGSPVSQRNLAWALVASPDPKLRDPKRAVELAMQSAKAAPKVPAAWSTLGVAHYRAGNWQSAALALQHAFGLFHGRTGLEPDYGRSLFFLAMAQWRLGHPQKAWQSYERAVKWLKANHQELQRTPSLAEELDRVQGEAEKLLKKKDS
jgi:tetratricopeptide (TPR) repeat protein